MPKDEKSHRAVRIARALQLAFLVLVILPVILVTAVAYVNSRQALQDEIRHRLRQDASVLVQGVDAFMFERLENLRGWQRLSVMQDAQVNDVDKRLADFLQQLKTSYGGIYTELLFVDPGGRVVASSEPFDIDSGISNLGAPVEQVLLGGTGIEIMPLQRDRQLNTAVLPLRTAVQSDFETEPLGWLYAFLDWHEVEAILDRVTGGGEVDAFRFAILLDRVNRPLGHSATGAIPRIGKEVAVLDAVQSQLDGAASVIVPAREKHDALMGTLEIPSSPTSDDGLLVGYAVSSGFQHFRGFGWRVVVAESMDTAFAPVRHLLWLLLLVLLVTVVISVFLAARLGAWISGPIARLAEYSNHCGDELSPAAP
ncbi:MAG TPA: hypothetical protein ENJ35_04940, partial [Gammaproteobacteria bacterium]|nr:hypothetical protein [Gammaproteobacteria bacterium]